jgi:hypothetical protein
MRVNITKFIKLSSIVSDLWEDNNLRGRFIEELSIILESIDVPLFSEEGVYLMIDTEYVTQALFNLADSMSYDFETPDHILDVMEDLNNISQNCQIPVIVDIELP